MYTGFAPITGIAPAPNIGRIGSYLEMSKLTKGYNGAIQAHHLVEARNLKVLGESTSAAPAVIIDKTTHQYITNTLRTEMPYGQVYKTEQMMNAYQKAYQAYPEWVDYVKILLGY